MSADVAAKLERARVLTQEGWNALLERDEIRVGRSRLVEARRELAGALRDPAPQEVRFEAVGTLAELSAQLGDRGTVSRCAKILPMLAPKNNSRLLEGLLRRMIVSWFAFDEAQQALGALRHIFDPAQAAGLEIALQERRSLVADAPLTTAQILELKRYLARAGIVQFTGGRLVRFGGQDLKLTSAWISQRHASPEVCLEFLARLGGTTDMDVLLRVNPVELYDVTAAWETVALARKARAAAKQRGSRGNTGSHPMAISAPLSAPLGSQGAAQQSFATPSMMAGAPPSAASVPMPQERAAPPAPAPAAPAPAPVPAAPKVKLADTTFAPDSFVVPFEDPYSRFKGRFEDDGQAGYIYLFNRSGKRRVMEPLFVYNRVSSEAALPETVPQDQPGPPVPTALLSEPHPLPADVRDRIELHMADDGAWVGVQLDGRLMALLDYHQKAGWSRLLAQDTPFGFAWTEGLPEEL